MDSESKMNMLSPDVANQKLWHVDVESGKVVSEWGFEKHSIETPMKVRYPTANVPAHHTLFLGANNIS